MPESRRTRDMRCLKTKSSGSSEFRLSRSSNSSVGLEGDEKDPPKEDVVERPLEFDNVDEDGPD